MNALAPASQPLVNATRFRQAHEQDWARLDDLVTRMEKRSIRAIADEDLLALPILYRSALSSLSVARDTSLDRALVTYLEQLCTRAYFQLYGVQTPPGRQILDFFRVGWPSAVRAIWLETLICVLLTIGAALLAYILIIRDPSWFYAIIPEGLAGGRDPTASAADLKATLYGHKEEALMIFATFLFTHNSQIAIFAFALGFAFAIPTVLLIIYNGLMLGAFLAVFASKGLGPNMAAWLTIHGTTEMFAICLAGAAGMRIGRAVVFPGRLSRMDAMVRSGRLAATAMGGTVIMLAIAGLLEGIGRQAIDNDMSRVLIGAAAFACWITYFYLWRARGVAR
ncbi:MAG: stage II sporulation protein M [Sphingomicrobium sp.]